AALVEALLIAVDKPDFGMFVEIPGHDGNRVHGKHIILGQPRQVFTARGIEAGIKRRRDSGVLWQPDKPYPGIASGTSLRNRPTAVWARVIHHDDFDIRVTLQETTINRLLQMTLPLIARDHN